MEGAQLFENCDPVAHIGPSWVLPLKSHTPSWRRRCLSPTRYSSDVSLCGRLGPVVKPNTQLLSTWMLWFSWVRVRHILRSSLSGSRPQSAEMETVAQRRASMDDSFHLPNFPHMAWKKCIGILIVWFKVVDPQQQQQIFPRFSPLTIQNKMKMLRLDLSNVRF